MEPSPGFLKPFVALLKYSLFVITCLVERQAASSLSSPQRGVFGNSHLQFCKSVLFLGPLCGGKPSVNPPDQVGHVCPSAPVYTQEAGYAASTDLFQVLLGGGPAFVKAWSWPSLSWGGKKALESELSRGSQEHFGHRKQVTQQVSGGVWDSVNGLLGCVTGSEHNGSLASPHDENTPGQKAPARSLGSGSQSPC